MCAPIHMLHVGFPEQALGGFSLVLGLVAADESTYSEFSWYHKQIVQSSLSNMQAIEEGRQYPEYIWLTPGWYQGGWWREDEAYLLNLNCSLTSLEQQLERSLALLPHPNSVRDT